MVLFAVGDILRSTTSNCEFAASLLAAVAICKLVDDLSDPAEFILDTVYNKYEITHEPDRFRVSKREYNN